MHVQLDRLRRALFLVSIPLFFITFALPVRARELGASAVEVGALFSLFTICLLALRPLVGVGLDRIGRRPFFLGALVMYVLANAAFALANDIVTMYFARIVQGLGAALLLITVDAMTADLTSTNQDRGVAMARNLETQSRASIAGAFLGFALIGASPVLAWQWSFGLFAAFAFAAVLYSLLYGAESFDPNGEAHPEPSGTADVIESQMTRSALSSWLVIVLLAGFASALIHPIYLIFAQDRFALSVEMLAWAFLPAGFVYAVAPARMSLLVGRFGADVALMTGFVAAGLLYVLLPHLPDVYTLVGAYTLSALGWALAEPARKTITASLSGHHNRGRTFGTVELVVGVGAVAGPLIGGYLYDEVARAAPFYVNGLVLLLATALVWGRRVWQARTPATV